MIGYEKNKNALLHINTNTVCVAVCMNKNALLHINTNTVCVAVCMNKKARRRDQLTHGRSHERNHDLLNAYE